MILSQILDNCSKFANMWALTYGIKTRELVKQLCVTIQLECNRKNINTEPIEP